MTEKIPYEAIQEIAERFGLSHIIMFASEGAERHHVVTWGESSLESNQAAEFGNELKKAMGWPEYYQMVSPKVEKLCNWVLRSHFQATVSEGMASELLAVGRVELRQMMIERYGEDWRAISGDEEIAKQRMIAAGDIDETIKYLNECGIGVNPDGTTYPLDEGNNDDD